MVPAAFARLNASAHAPANAIVLITLVSIGGMLLGKGALIPIINMAMHHTHTRARSHRAAEASPPRSAFAGTCGTGGIEFDFQSDCCTRVI